MSVPKLWQKLFLATLIFHFICWPSYARNQMLEKGSMAPDFEALSFDGESIKLSNLTAHGPVILVFLRGLT